MTWRETKSCQVAQGGHFPGPRQCCPLSGNCIRPHSHRLPDVPKAPRTLCTGRQSNSRLRPLSSINWTPYVIDIRLENTERSMSYLDRDHTKPTSELLGDISAAAQQHGFPGLPLLPFGALLVKIAGEATETVADLKAHITDLNTKNAKLQWWVTALALAALVSTLVQTGVAIASYRSVPAGTQAATPSMSVSGVSEPPTSAASHPLPTIVMPSVLPGAQQGESGAIKGK